jgi:hypothetical protein
MPVPQCPLGMRRFSLFARTAEHVVGIRCEFWKFPLQRSSILMVCPLMSLARRTHRKMRGDVMKLTAIVACSVLAACLSNGALAKGPETCVSQVGRGVGYNADAARFQAYSSMLAVTDLSAWVQWRASDQKIGVAPGYKVRDMRFRCSPLGVGMECSGPAKFCR